MAKYDDLYEGATAGDSVFADKRALDPLAEPEEIVARAGQEAELAAILGGIEEVRKRLEPDENLPVQKRRVIPATWDGGRPIERVGLLVSEHCEHTITEFLGYEEEDVGKSGADDHCMDTLRYAIMGVSRR